MDRLSRTWGIAVSVGRFAALTAGVLTTHAAPPVLDHLFPAAVQSGVTNSVALVGKFEPWPPQIWADSPGIQFQPATHSPQVQVTVDRGVTPGPHWIRAFSKEGASSPHLLVVTTDPLTLEQEPNDDSRHPQTISRLPVVVEGRLEKAGDVDSFAVELKSGETLVAWVDAYTLMTPLDPALRIVDSQGVQVAWNHDSVLSLDPFLTWTPEHPGTYVVQAFGFAYPADSDVRFAGSPKGVYRLHLSTGPVVHHTLPLGAQRGVATPLQPRGWNLGHLPGSVSVTARESESNRPGYAWFQPAGVRDPIEIPLGDGAELQEHEPNHTVELANPVPVPGAITGGLHDAEDVDRFRFVAKKGQPLVLEVQAARLGFPLDAWLQVEDATGKQLTRNDDAAGSDPRIEWTAPQDGTYYAAVGNLVHSDGADLWYRFEIRPSLGSYEASVADSAFAVEPGKTNEIKITLKRMAGFGSAVRLRASDLPSGVRADPIDIASGSSEGTLKLIAAPSANPHSGPFQILASDSGSHPEQAVFMSLAATGENNGVPQGFSRLLLERISRLWLTVASSTNAAAASPK